MPHAATESLSLVCTQRIERSAAVLDAVMQDGLIDGLDG